MKKLLSAFALVTLIAMPAWAATQSVTLAVSKMTCAACPITVKTALSRVPGVSNVSVSMASKQATVIFDDAKTTIAGLTRATTDAGYPSTPVASATR